MDELCLSDKYSCRLLEKDVVQSDEFKVLVPDVKKG